MRPTEDAGLTSRLEQVLQAAMQLQGADFGDIELYDPDRRTLRIVAHRGVGKAFLDHFGCIDANDPSGCGTAMRAGHRVVIEDIMEHAAYAPHLAVAAATGYRGVSCTPLRERDTGSPLGMLTTLFREPYRPNEARLQLSDLFADQAADLVSSHRSQEGLREREEFFRLALDGGQMGTWEWDSETHLIKADAAHQALFGMPPQERPMPSEAYWKLMDLDEEKIGTRRTQEALEQGKDIQLEQRIHLPNGDVRWIAIRGRPHHDGSDSIIGISHDITELKEQGEALRNNHAWMAAILDQLPGGVGLFDKDGVAVMRGGPLGRLWDGALLHSAASRRIWRSFDSTGRPLPFDEYPGARALNGEIVSPGIDFLYTGSDRREHWYRVSSAPFRDETGAISGATVFIQDVHQEKLAEERLRQSEERLNAAVELAGLSLYSLEIDPGGGRLTWDNRVRSLWGLPPDCEVTYDMWESAIHADDRDRVRAAVARAYDPSGDGVYDVEYRVIGADGVERWVATRAQTRFEYGQPVSLLGVARDITDRKMIEHGLELVIDVRESELQEVSASLEAEAQAHERVSERLELLQSELSRGLFAAIENRQKGPSLGTPRNVVEAARKVADLSPRERQVLDGLVRGEPHKQIAHRLGISARTVELHRTRMLHRLGTPHLADAIRLAVLAELAAE